jgi:hypothetical protein
VAVLVVLCWISTGTTAMSHSPRQAREFG